MLLDDFFDYYITRHITYGSHGSKRNVSSTILLVIFLMIPMEVKEMFVRHHGDAKMCL